MSGLKNLINLNELEVSEKNVDVEELFFKNG
jgi:hypothetical protein